MSILDNEGHAADGLGNRPTRAEVSEMHAEIARLRTALSKVITWVDGLAAQSSAQEKQNRGRFDSLADACAADAKNYRATARNLRSVLNET